MKRYRSSNPKKRFQALTDAWSLSVTSRELLIETLPTLLAGLKDASPRIREVAAEQLSTVAEREPALLFDHLSAFTPMFHDRRAMVRQYGNRILAQLAHEAPERIEGMVPLLIEQLGYSITVDSELTETETGVITTAATALRVLAADHPGLVLEAVPAMVRCLTYPLYRPELPHEGLEAMYFAALTFFTMIGWHRPNAISAAVPAVIKCYADAFTFSRWSKAPRDEQNLYTHVRSLIETVGAKEPALFLPSLIRLLASEDEALVKDAGALIDRLGENVTMSISALIRSLNARDEDTRTHAPAAVLRVARRDPAIMMSTLVNWLTSPAPETRLAVADALFRLTSAFPDQTPTVLPALLKRVTDTSLPVRQKVIEGLGELAGDQPTFAAQIAPVLLNRLKDPTGNIRWMTVCALEHFRGQTSLLRTIIPQLVTSYRVDPEDPVRWRAKSALETFGVDTELYEALFKEMQFARSLLGTLKRLGSELETVRSEFTAARAAIKDLDYATAFGHARTATSLANRILRESYPFVVGHAHAAENFHVGWITLRFDLLNIGTATAEAVRISLDDDIETTGISLLKELAATESQTIELRVRFPRPARRSITAKLEYRDPNGKPFTTEEVAWVTIEKEVTHYPDYRRIFTIGEVESSTHSGS